jgi:hypothetical protein
MSITWFDINRGTQTTTDEGQIIRSPFFHRITEKVFPVYSIDNKYLGFVIRDIFVSKNEDAFSILLNLLFRLSIF